MSICSTSRAESAEAGLEAFGHDADDGEVAGVLATLTTGGDLATSWNVGVGETARDERRQGELKRVSFGVGHAGEGNVGGWSFWINADRAVDMQPNSSECSVLGLEA
jgi:hypothetical protein